MSQFSMTIPNEAGAAFRADVNSALAALVSQSSGATAPATMFAYMLWADTTNALWKMRNAANTAWITLAPIGNTLISTSGGQLTGAINEAPSVGLTAAATTNIGAAASANVTITGTTTITAFDTVAEGILRVVAWQAATPVTYNVTSMQLVGAASKTYAAGDVSIFKSLGTGYWKEVVYQPSSIMLTQAQGDARYAGNAQTVGVAMAANAVTISALNSVPLTFRSATATSGATSQVLTPSANLVIPSGATLGTVNAVPSTIVIAELNNAGTREFAICNIAGGLEIDEQNLISTTAISAAATAANVWYSTTARTSLPYRIIATFSSTQATAGTWATAASAVQPVFGEVSLGIFRTPNVTPLPAVSTSLTASHALGVIPSTVSLEFICLTAELGYSVGDVVQVLGLWNASVAYPASSWASASQVGVPVPSTYAPYVFNKTTGAATTPTAANWAYRFVLQK